MKPFTEKWHTRTDLALMLFKMGITTAGHLALQRLVMMSVKEQTEQMMKALSLDLFGDGTKKED